ncbi:MAG: right-handed parallel beta-helix repeat-containing protein [Paludibacter sp.]
MKKLITLMLSITFMCSISAFAAKTYLVELGTSGEATWRAPGVGDTIINLQVVGTAGAAVTLNEWLNDKRLATPVFSGHAFTSGDQIWLAKGTYTINGRDSLTAGVSMYGGFAGTEFGVTDRAKASALPWDYANPTIIDGAGAYIGIMTTSSATLTSVIDGITFQNCANSNRNSSGGGAKIQGAKTVMQNCIVTLSKATGTVATGASAGVTLLSKGTLKDSYIHHNTGTSTGTSAGGVSVYGDTCVVTGCKIEYNSNGGSGGLYLYSKTSGVKILNCSISNNTANGATNANGGGIGSYITAVNAAPITIENCTITGNIAAGSGGGAYLNQNTATNIYKVIGCTFSSNVSNAAGGNSATGGGGLHIQTCNYIIDKCTFTGNSSSAASNGGLLIASSSSCLITNSKFISNTSPNSGSAIYCKSSLTANNCLFAGNTGTTVIHFYAGLVSSSFNNCTFANNLSSAAAPANIQLLALTPKYSFTNCLFNKIGTYSAQIPLFNYCGFETTVPAGGTNCITDITDASFNNYAAGDYSLSQFSPAVDTGLNLTDSIGNKKITTDILGCARPVGTGYDMGCYEYGGVPPTAVIAPHQDVIGFTTMKNALVSKYTGVVRVISMSGKLFKNGLIAEGEQIQLPSGVYIVRLTSSKGDLIQKVVL